MDIYVSVSTKGYIRKELAPLLHIIKSDKRYNVIVDDKFGRPYAHRLQRVVNDFLKTNAQFLLQIDHDNVPLKNPLDLIELNKDVIGMPYLALRNGEYGFLTFERNKAGKMVQAYPPENEIQLVQVDRVSSGAILIARRVLEKIKEPFMREWKDGLAIKGADFSFCDKVKAAGFEIWAHWGHIASHYKEIDLLEIPKLIEKYN
jgi:hypothetical protein